MGVPELAVDLAPVTAITFKSGSLVCNFMEKGGCFSVEGMVHDFHDFQKATSMDYRVVKKHCL